MLANGLIQRERTPLPFILYALYLYYSGLSLRCVSKALRRNITRDWRPDHTKDVYMLYSALVDLDAKHGGSWGVSLANKVRLTSKEMQSMVFAHQHGKHEEARAHGEVGYELATSLISLLRSEKKQAASP